jgi:hypothetical protein
MRTPHLIRGLALAALVAPVGLAQTMTPLQVNTVERSLDPAISFDGNLGVVVAPRRVRDQWQVFAYVSTNGGATWSPGTRLDSDNSRAPKRVQPWSVWIVDGTIFAAWEDDRAGVGRSATDLYFTRSTNGGASWIPEKLVPKGFPAGGHPVCTWRMMADMTAAGAKTVFFVLGVQGQGDGDVLYAVPSFNAGSSFGAPVPVSSSSADVDEFDALVVDGSRLQVVWLDDRTSRNQVYFRQSVQGGAWSGPEVALSAPGFFASETLSIARRNDRVLVAWQQEGGSTKEQLLTTVSTNGGTSWSAPLMVGNYVPALEHDVDTPAAAITQGYFVVTWTDDRTGRDEVYVASSLDGTTWTEAGLSTLSSGGGRRPVFARSKTQASGTWVLWTTFDYPSVVEAAHSTDGGATWPSVTQVSTLNGRDMDGATGALDAGTGIVLAAFLGGNPGSTVFGVVDDLYVSLVSQ